MHVKKKMTALVWLGLGPLETYSILRARAPSAQGPAQYLSCALLLMFLYITH